MDEAIDISRGKDEAAAKLEGVGTQFMLMMAGSAGAIAGLEIIWAGEVK